MSSRTAEQMAEDLAWTAVKAGLLRPKGGI